MYIITKESAEDYEQAATLPATTKPAPGLFPQGSSTADQPREPTPFKAPSDTPNTKEPEQLALGLTWSGEVPSQKWMNFTSRC